LGRASFGPAGGQPFEKVAKHIKIKVQSTLSKNLFAPLFKSGQPEPLIINSSYYLNHSPSPILHAIPLIFALLELEKNPGFRSGAKESIAPEWKRFNKNHSMKRVY
jgi:hypothetical protein